LVYLKTSVLFYEILVNQEYRQKEIKDNQPAATCKVKGQPGFVILQNKIKNHRSDCRQYCQPGKNAYDYLLFH
jgi:hypothetical protein